MKAEVNAHRVFHQHFQSTPALKARNYSLIIFLCDDESDKKNKEKVKITEMCWLFFTEIPAKVGKSDTGRDNRRTFARI